MGMIAEGDREGWILFKGCNQMRMILEVALRNPITREKAVDFWSLGIYSRGEPRE